MQEYLREYTGKGWGQSERYASASRASTHLMKIASRAAQAAGSTARTRSMGGDIPTSVVQGQQAAQRRRRRNAGVPSGVPRRQSTSCQVTATPRSHGLERMKAAELWCSRPLSTSEAADGGGAQPASAPWGDGEIPARPNPCVGKVRGLGPHA